MTDAGLQALSFGGRRYPVVLPQWRDPRLHLAAVIVTLQVLGQTVLGFELSIAQILVSIGTCAAIESGIAFRRDRVLLWPTSALLAGNGVAFILRVPGTRHGDWWSLHGAWIFALAAALSVASKYVVRRGGHHVLNPSNLGLVTVFVLLGTRRVNPQDLWWGAMSRGLELTLAVIVIGEITLAYRLRMFGVAVAFWVTFAAAVGVIAASGHAMSARWHVGAVSGHAFWWVLVTSPEILVFMCFMITDPKTAPGGAAARAVFGAVVALVAALLIAPSRTEFETKVAILAALTLACAFRPLIERIAAAVTPARRTVVLRTVAVAAASAILLVIAGLPARTIRPPQVAVATDRPRTAVDPASLPPVSVDAAVHDADPSFTPATARRMALDLAAELGDGRRFTALTAVVVHDQHNPQTPPRIGIRATGTAGDGAPFSATYALEVVRGAYVIASSAIVPSGRS